MSGVSQDFSGSLRHEMAEGLLYTHTRLNTNTHKTLESASFLYALVELLSDKGLITVEELDERKRGVVQRLAKQFRQLGMVGCEKGRVTTC
jgi:hypothetical protein